MLLFFVGCPLFGITGFYRRSRDAALPPPHHHRYLSARRSEAGELLVWLGSRIALAIEPRSRRPASPLLIIE